MEEMFENIYDTYDFIWGIVSLDDMSGSQPSLMSLNDIDLVYDKETHKYELGIETIYEFETEDGCKTYLKGLYDEFTKWMLSNNYDVNYKLNYDEVFTQSKRQWKFDSIEQAYAYFKFLVLSYTNNF